MGKKSTLYTDRTTFIFDCIKNKKEVKEDIVINFMQNEMHDLLYSYVNGGFSNKGFIFYPLVKDLSKKNINKIENLRIIAIFLKENGHDFNNTLRLFEKNKINGKSTASFISSFYKDFANIKKPKTKNKKIDFNKLDLKKYVKKI